MGVDRQSSPSSLMKFWVTELKLPCRHLLLNSGPGPFSLNSVVPSLRQLTQLHIGSCKREVPACVIHDSNFVEVSALLQFTELGEWNRVFCFINNIPNVCCCHVCRPCVVMLRCVGLFGLISIRLERESAVFLLSENVGCFVQMWAWYWVHFLVQISVEY